MKQRGKMSVGRAIVEALTDLQRFCNEFDSRPVFLWGLFTVRVRAYIGNDYRPSDRMISRRLRKIRQFGYNDGINNITLEYKAIGNKIYTFKIK